MKLYMGGGEIPTHRRWLAENGVTDVYLSYMGLRRRVKFARPWLIDEKFPAGMNVMLDAGAYTVNREDAQHDPDELADIAAGYEAFVSANAGRVAAFTEFDALPLGLGWIKSRRRDFYDDLGDNFMPVWHAEWGLEELEQMASRYHRIGILQTALGDRDLVPVLNLLQANRGTLLHGLAMTKPDIMREIRWDSVGSTSWISPMQFGDTFVWTGREIKRYPKKYKEQARKRHRTLFVSNGFDAEKIAADDTAEIVRLSLWSWQQFMNDLNSHRRPNPTAEVQVSEEEPTEQVQIPSAPPQKRERELLPGVSMVQPEGRTGLELSVRGDTLRECNTCFLATRNCPGFQAGAECLYELPIEVSSKDQVRAVENGLIAMQTQRVMFMKMVEEKEGGYPDPNLSSEIDRLTRMIKAQREGEAEKFNLSITATNKPGELGALNRIFGRDVAEAQQIMPPTPVDDMIRESQMADVFDAEIVEESKNG